MAPALLVRPEEVARLLGISRTRTYELLRTGQLKSIKLGRARRVRRCDIELLIDGLATYPGDPR